MKKESVSPILLVCRYKAHFFMLYTKVALGGAFIPYGNTYLWYIIMLFVFLSSIEDDEHLDRRITQGKILHDKKECCIQWKKGMLHSVKKGMLHSVKWPPTECVWFPRLQLSVPVEDTTLLWSTWHTYTELLIFQYCLDLYCMYWLYSNYP